LAERPFVLVIYLGEVSTDCSKRSQKVVDSV
jgi:hypothetical protein